MMCPLMHTMHSLHITMLKSCSDRVLYMCSHWQGGVGEKSAKQEKDELIMSLLLDEVLPKATTLYMAGPLQVQQQEHLLQRLVQAAPPLCSVPAPYHAGC